MSVCVISDVMTPRDRLAN